ncbi:putative secreted RxLR effector protein [Phytophthora cinnamomi]|uniref:putative secreted RxLR effector protein n=1 Tax=Phytophthora cinnamomi TaxID=4785 RepID=UPI00355AA9A2|nr:putative secreted RxLR effector protein [Phytophthora cinnamomi]
MKVSAIALLISAAALAGASAADTTSQTLNDVTQRNLRVETSPDAIETDLRDDDLGESEDFWGSWDSHYAQAQRDPRSNAPSSASGSGAHEPTVGDLPAAAKEMLDKVESVATAAMPFSVETAESYLLLAILSVAALFVIVIAAVLIGVRRQQMSEPRFGPVELASDLPEPMTTSAGSEAGEEGSDAGSPSHGDDGGEADTGATILFGDEEEEKEEEADNERVDHVAA